MTVELTEEEEHVLFLAGFFGGESFSEEDLARASRIYYTGYMTGLKEAESVGIPPIFTGENNGS